MRRLLIAPLTMLAAFVAAGCEDGPDQPYSPPPSNAADNWNNSKTPGHSDPSKQGFDGGGSTGTNKVELCSGPEKAKRWAEMVNIPIEPPRKGAGIDLAGDETWTGITIEKAEEINCQSDELGDWGSTPVNSWGDNGEVWFVYSAATRLGYSMHFWAGYNGTLDATSRDGKDKYVVHVNSAMTKNGEKFPIHWKGSEFPDEVNAIGDAMMATWAPDLPAATTANCYSTRMCITGEFGDVAYIYIPVIGLGLWTPSQFAPVEQNIIDRVDMYLEKILPFSLSHPHLKLDSEGPVAGPSALDGEGKTIWPAVLNAATGQPCKMRFGMTYDDFLANCVKVSEDPAAAKVAENKLLGGILHGREQFHFNITGLTVDFLDKDLQDDKLLGDEDRPEGGDWAAEFTLSQAMMGKVINDRHNNDPNAYRDNHGAGLVYLEYARIVQNELNKYVAATHPGATLHTLGDPECLEPNVLPDGSNMPEGCTGFEGFVTCAPKGTGDADMDRLALGFDEELGPVCAYVHYDMVLGLKPGHPSSAFCTDITDDPAINPTTGLPTNGFQHCVVGDLWQTSFDRVLNVFGHGKLENMPYEIRDTRFFYRAYVKALIKYFVAAGEGNETPVGVHNAKYSFDDLHFDSAGAGQWETAAYIDRRFANESPPVAFTVTADIKNGIFNDYEFSRQLYRGEKLIYETLRQDQAEGLGKRSNAQLTNVFGSPVLANGWTAVGSGAQARTAFQCATGCASPTADCEAPDPVTVAICQKNGMSPPVDKDGNVLVHEDGAPILAHYPAAFGGAQTAFAMGGQHLKVTNIRPFLASADVTVPVWLNPYKPDETPTKSFTQMVSYEPKQPGIGFNIPINGQLDKFIQTYHTDLTGRTVSLHLAWDWALDPETYEPKTDGSIDILALHSDDFLGDVFLCQDTATRDLLRARMYTTTDELLDWLIQHPDATTECQIIIRYSPFGNYPDYISSLQNGVTVGITQGGGKGRVVDATLFVPGQ